MQCLVCNSKAAVTFNESISTVKKTSLFVSLNRSHCTELLQWVAKPLCQKRLWSFFLQWFKSMQKTCKVFDCKVIETRPQVSHFYYLHASFSVKNLYSKQL